MPSRKPCLPPFLPPWLRAAGLAAIVLAVAALPAAAYADVVVVVNPANHQEMGRDQVKNIFLGLKSEYPDGSRARPVDQAEDRPLHEAFYRLLAGKNPGEMKVYWSTLIFTGNATPPKTLGDDAEIKKYVRDNPGAIGYIDSTAVDATIRVLFTLK